MVLDAFSKVDARGSDVEYCDALFLDVSSTDNDANSSCVCIAGTTVSYIGHSVELMLKYI